MTLACVPLLPLHEWDFSNCNGETLNLPSLFGSVTNVWMRILKSQAARMYRGWLQLLATQPCSGAAAWSVWRCLMWLWLACIRWCYWQAQRSQQASRTCRLVLFSLARMCSQKWPGQGCMALPLSLQAPSWGMKQHPSLLMTALQP